MSNFRNSPSPSYNTSTEYLSQMVNGQPLGRKNIKITIWWNLNIIETLFRIGLVPDVAWGIIILDNLVNILILGKSLLFF